MTWARAGGEPPCDVNHLPKLFWVVPRRGFGRGGGRLGWRGSWPGLLLQLLLLCGSLAEDEGGPPLSHRHSILLLRPLNGSCLSRGDGNSISLAFTSSIFELSPSAWVQFSINGHMASQAALEQSRPTDQNVKLSLPWLEDGNYAVDVAVASATSPAGGGVLSGERLLGRLTVVFEVDAHGSCEHLEGGNEGGAGMGGRGGPLTDAFLPDVGCSGRGEAGWDGTCPGAGLGPLGKWPGARMSCNVALLKQAMQSSTHEDYAAEHAVNGMTGVGRDELGASASRTRVEGRPWWMVDLGRDREVVEVIVHREMLTRGATVAQGSSQEVPEYPQVVGDRRAARLRVRLYTSGGMLTWRGEVERGQDTEAFALEALVRARFVKVEAECQDDDAAAGGGCALGLSEVLVMEDGCWVCEEHCVNGKCGGKGGDVCECDADWFGQDCSHRMMTSVAYLPTRHQQGAWERQQAKTWLEGNGLWERAMAMIQNHQSPASCSMQNAKVLHCPHAGLASSLHAMAGHVSLGIKHGFCAVASTSQPFEYALDHPTCASRDYSCYFRDWSRCSPRGLDPDAPADAHAPFYHVPEDEVEHFLHVPSAFQTRGVFWWRLATVSFVARINRVTLDAMALSSVKARLNYTHPIIGMHVRRGDSCHTTSRRGKCVSIGEHVAHARHLSRRYGISKVFLASDDPEAPSLVREGLPGMHVITLDTYDRQQLQSGDQVWLEQRLAQGQVPAYNLAIFTLTDLLLLAEADAFVLQFASNLSRMAYMLSLLQDRDPDMEWGGRGGLRGVFAPFVSVDGPWCYHWRMCCHLSSAWPHSSVC